MELSVSDSTSDIDSNSKGSRLKTQGRKANVWQGSKRQGSKDVTRAVVGRECPAKSYVSSFLIQNFAGFLSGRIYPHASSVPYGTETSITSG